MTAHKLDHLVQDAGPETGIMSNYLPHFKHHVISHAYCPRTEYQKSPHPPNPLHMAVFYECVPWSGRGHSSAWLNASIQTSFANHTWLPHCINNKRS